MTEVTARFALDEDKAAELAARNLTESYAPAKASSGKATSFLVHHAVNEGAISDPLHCDAETLAISITGTHARWTLSVDTGPGPDDYLTLASEAFTLDTLTRYTGQAGATDVLREAVTAGNILAEELDRYVAALPLAVRAPEIAQLAAMLPGGEWGADELGTVSNWLNGLGFDTTGDAEPFHADCACCMSGCNGGEPGTRCGNCHHVETGR